MLEIWEEDWLRAPASFLKKAMALAEVKVMRAPLMVLSRVPGISRNWKDLPKVRVTVFSPSPTLYLPGMEMPATLRVKVLSVLLKVQVMAPGFTPILARYSSALDSIPEVTAEPARLEMMPPSELVTETAIPL